MTEKIVHIFQKATELHKTLGILHAAIQARDEVTTSNQFKILMNGFIPNPQLTQIALETLDRINSWGNPFLTMTAVGEVIRNAKAGSPLLDTALGRYLDAAASVKETHPLTMMQACHYVWPYAHGTPHEARMYDEIEAVCRNAHSGSASMLLEALMDLQEKAFDNDIFDTRLADHLISLAGVVMTYDPSTAMDAYSCALEDMSPGDARMLPLLEAFLTVCKNIAPQNSEGAAIGIDQILSNSSPNMPVHKAAKALKDEMAARIAPGDYSHSRPLTPDQYLSQKGPKLA